MNITVWPCTRCKKLASAEGRYLKRGKPGAECKQCTIDRSTERRAKLPKKGRSEVQIERFTNQERVPVEKLQAFLKRYKAEHDMTWAEIAEKAGVGLYKINHILYDHTGHPVTGFDGEDVRNMARRLHGLPADPSPYMMNKYQRDLRKRHHLPDGSVRLSKKMRRNLRKMTVTQL